MRIADIHLEATRAVSRKIAPDYSPLRTVMTLWAVLWSIMGPISFLMWCSFAYHWF